MKKYLQKLAAAVAIAFALLSPAKDAVAQTVTKQPYFAQNSQWVDAGNGPLEIFPLNGNGNLYTSSGGGVSNTVTASTAMTLQSSAAANPPCVGCIISGAGITSGTTVAAFNGTTGITLSAAMTVANNTPVSWGVACPTSGQAPTGSLNLSAPIDMRATAGGGDTAYPMFTQARLCVWGAQQAGVSFLAFAIGAW